eukprot:373757_1
MTHYPTPQKPHQEQLVKLLTNVGYTDLKQFTDSLQGSIWTAKHQPSNKKVVIKVADKYLHNESLTIRDGEKIKVSENILMEKRILKNLSKDKQCPQ